MSAFDEVAMQKAEVRIGGNSARYVGRAEAERTASQVSQSDSDWKAEVGGVSQCSEHCGYCRAMGEYIELRWKRRDNLATICRSIRVIVDVMVDDC